MRITYFGHACLLFEWDGTSLLCDPWLSDQGAFYAAWFQFPDVEPIRKTVPRAPTHVYISHEHQDHLDPRFLAEISRDTEFLISDHPSPWVSQTLSQLGFTKIRQVPSLAPFLLNGAKVSIIASDDPSTPDSALWIEHAGKRYLNQNDCEFSGPFMKRLREQLPTDVHFLQYAPANWFPMVYDYPQEQKREIYPRRRASRLDKFADFVEGIGARHVVGFAGPAVFLDSAFIDASLPSGGLIPNFGDVQLTLRKRGLPQTSSVPLPGDELDPDGVILSKGPYAEWIDSDDARHDYILQYAKRKKTAIEGAQDSLTPGGTDFPQRLKNHLVTICKRAPFLAKNLNMVVRFVLRDLGTDVTLDASNWPVRVYEGADDAANYRIETESKFILPIVEGQWNWDWFLLSMRFRASRNPDTYNPWLQAFLSRSTPREARLIEAFQRRQVSETIEVTAKGARFEIERYCPHALADLSAAKIVGENIVCQRHGMSFNLETGKCAEQGVRSLKTRRI